MTTETIEMEKIRIQVSAGAYCELHILQMFVLKMSCANQTNCEQFSLKMLERMHAYIIQSGKLANV